MKKVILIFTLVLCFSIRPQKSNAMYTLAGQPYVSWDFFTGNGTLHCYGSAMFVCATVYGNILIITGDPTWYIISGIIQPEHEVGPDEWESITEIIKSPGQP